MRAHIAHIAHMERIWSAASRCPTARRSFREVSAKLGNHLRRVPDGETGIRTNWIQWQFPLLVEVPEFESANERPGAFGARLQLRTGVTGEQIDFPELGYRAAALEFV